MSIIIDCPANCGSVLPETLFNECNPSVGFGEIQSIYIGVATAAPFTDWTDAAQWSAALGKPTSDINALRELVVTGDLPVSAADEVVISKGRKVYSPATHSISFDIDDLSGENYEFARTTSCNLQFRIWFMTANWMFGGNEGILAMINIRPVIERGIKSLNKLTGTATWDSKFSPDRAVSVYSDIDTPAVVDLPVTITSALAVYLEENAPFPTYVQDLTADNADTFAITGGADSALFEINTNALFFILAPDYENPLDANSDNVYEVEITASNSSYSDTETVMVNVLDNIIPD